MTDSIKTQVDNDMALGLAIAAKGQGPADNGIHRSQAHLIANALSDTRKAATLAERERCAGIASLFSFNGSRLRPGIAWGDLSETTRHLAHATAQTIAAAIRKEADDVGN